MQRHEVTDPLSIRKVANGFVVEPVNAPGVARKPDDTFVFETLAALFAYLQKRFEGVK